jgi:hypothetical protein
VCDECCGVDEFATKSAEIPERSGKQLSTIFEAAAKIDSHAMIGACFSRPTHLATSASMVSADIELFEGVRPHRLRIRPRLRLLLIAIVTLAASLVGFSHWPRPRIGATTIVTEASTGLALEARVDTGAALCSIHCEEIEIEDESRNPDENIGRQIRFRIRNNAGQMAWVKTRIVDHSGIRNSVKTTDRYFVHLRLRAAGVEDTILVTLNDRTIMKYPVLIGRNFLRDSFVVDVSLDRGDDDID